MLPDRVSNPGPLTYESGALPIALRGPATLWPFAYKNIPKLMMNGLVWIEKQTILLLIEANMQFSVRLFDKRNIQYMYNIASRA